jgi:hypothetical protein
LAPLPRKVFNLRSIDNLLCFNDEIEMTIDLYSNMLTLVLSICVSYAEWCMIGFDLPDNYIDNPEALLKKTWAKLKKVLAAISKDNQLRRSLTPEFDAMAEKSLREFSAPQLPIFVLDQKSMLETMDLSSNLRSSPWCKLVSFVERLMKMQVQTYNTF